MSIRKTINRLVAGYFILMVTTVFATHAGYEIPFADYIVLVGGGILIVVITLMGTSFREEK